MSSSSTDQVPTMQAGDSLRGRGVLIVGGTSGIGLAAARQATAAGASVLVLGRDAEKAERAAAENGFTGWRAADVLDPTALSTALSDVPRVDDLVLLAGTFALGKLLEADLTQLHRAFDERVWAAVHVLRSLGGRLAPDASVTFVSGVLADRPTAQGTAILGAAAAAMEALARGLALELAPRRVNTVSPGTTDTPLLASALGSFRDDFLRSQKEKIPTGRVGTAEEVAAAVLFLMRNPSMNGATLHIDGGSRLT